jgi:hypothetical protein
MALSARGPTLVIAALAVAALLPAAPARAISNGVPDGNAHPNVGELALDEGGEHIAWCSGFYAGENEDEPGGVFVTAAHCLAGLPAGSQFSVTFDDELTIDPDTFFTTDVDEWVTSTGFATADSTDVAVVLLETEPAVEPVELPAAGGLDDLAAAGALRPRALFDNVGYGLIPSFKRGPASYELPPGRMRSTSLFQSLTPEWLRLLTNADATEGNGGTCYGDSGGPQFEHGTNRAVSFSAGGDPLCRARSRNLRLDRADVRAFLDRFIQLP